VAEGQPALTEQQQDLGNVVGFAAIASQGKRFRSSSGVLTTECLVSETERQLGVVIDSQLSLSAQVPLYVAVATTSYVSFHRSSDSCHLMP